MGKKFFIYRQHIKPAFWLFILFTYFSSSFAYAQEGPLSLPELLGTDIYEALSSEFEPAEWSYLSMLALKNSVAEELMLNGSYVATWDDSHAKEQEVMALIHEIKESYHNYLDFQNELKSRDQMDAEEVETAESFIAEAEEEIYQKREALIGKLWSIAVPRVSGSVIVEVMPPENNPESPIANGAILQFYKNLATANGWQVEELSLKPYEKHSGVLVEGGFPSSSILRISGRDVYRKLFLESGTHRFIYRDEHKSGNTKSTAKTHTSYVQSRVYPKPKARSFKFKESDVVFSFTRSSGPGGQHVNKTDSAVHAVHQPTGIAVFVQQERSQHRNKDLAIEMLKAKVFSKHLEEENLRIERYKSKSESELNAASSENPYVRTYNFVRSPRETGALLRGDIELEAFSAWRAYMQGALSLKAEELSLEVQELSSKLPQSNQSFSDVMLMRMDTKIQAGSCKAILK